MTAISNILTCTHKAKLKPAQHLNSAGNNQIDDALSWLDQNILAPGNIAIPDDFGQYSGEFNLDAPASNLSIDFLNCQGQIVQAIELGAQEPGPIVFHWDALDADGRLLPFGPLKVRVNGGTTSGLSTWNRKEFG